MNPQAWLQHEPVVLALALLVGIALERSRTPSALPALLGILSAASAVAVIALVVNHVRFPFFIDLMEGVVMQHAQRAMHGQGIYAMPTPEYVPLAYNALFYVLAAPFLLFFGGTLATLRSVAILGFLGSAVAMFVIARATTRSAWWGVIAVGLFCAAYPAMDAYLDSAHSDSWLLCCALWGTYLVGRPSRGARIAGILVLVAAFWFKQHGAVFLGVALLFLTWREGLSRALVYWLLALALGPLLYLLAPGPIFGPEFHYFTWHVPSGWSEFTVRSIFRVIRYDKLFLPVLTVAAVFGASQTVRSHKIGILELQLGAAFLTALMGALDPGSSNNVFIPMATFCILYGAIVLARIEESGAIWFGLRPALLTVALSFATLLRDPRVYWLPASARESYSDLQAMIRSLPGTVYAPGIGQLVDGPRLYPAAHWVALEDMMRGPHRTAADSALARRMLDPLRHPATPLFMLTNFPIETMSAPTRELSASFDLVHDYGDRFTPLTAVPRPYHAGWPRYLYRSVGEGAPAHVP